MSAAKTIRAGGRAATLLVADGRVSEVTYEGTTFDPDAARMVAAIGGERFPWLPWADAVDHTLALLPDADPQQVLDVVCTSEGSRVQLARASSDPLVWTALSVDRSDRVRSVLTSRILATDPTSPLLAGLLGDTHTEVRRKIATDARTPAALLARLAQDPSHLVRLRVARNPRAPEEVWDRLAADPHPSVRTEYARRDDIPERHLASLAADPELHVRIAIAQRHRLPEAVWHTLLTDRIATVRAEVLTLVRFPIPDRIQQRLLKDASIPVRVAAAAKVDLAVAEVMSRDSAAEVRAAVAERPDLPEPLVRTLAADRHRMVRARVGARKDLPEDLREMLAQDVTEYVRNSQALR